MKERQKNKQMKKQKNTDKNEKITISWSRPHLECGFKSLEDLRPLELLCL